MGTKSGGLADLVVTAVLPESTTAPEQLQETAENRPKHAEPSTAARVSRRKRDDGPKKLPGTTKRQRSFQLPEELRSELRERARQSTAERVLLQAIRNNFDELAHALKNERANEDTADTMFQGLGESEADEPGLHQNVWLFDTDHATIEAQADTLGFRNKSHLAATALRLEFQTPSASTRKRTAAT